MTPSLIGFQFSIFGKKERIIKTGRPIQHPGRLSLLLGE
jgi:hypothetical protein